MITLDGIQYTVAADKSEVNVDKNVLEIASITAKIKEGSTAVYNGKTFHAMRDRYDATKRKAQRSMVLMMLMRQLFQQQLLTRRFSRH